MGGKQSTAQEDGAVSTERLVEKLNNLSGNYGSKDPNGVNYAGMFQYLNQEAGMATTQSLPRGDWLVRSERYLGMRDLAEKIGMDDTAKDKLLATAYKNLNTAQNFLGDHGISAPEPSAPKQPTGVGVGGPVGNAAPAHAHSQDTVQSLNQLLANPHSYLALSGQRLPELLGYDKKTLDAVIHADQHFVNKTAGYWNLPQAQRQDTAANLGANYNERMCTHELHLAGTSNRTPIEAFLQGKEAAVNAVNQGYNIYGGQDNAALKAFGEVAMGVNLQIASGNTLVGRGASTISEETMAFSADGHALSGGGTRRY